MYACLRTLFAWESVQSRVPQHAQNSIHVPAPAAKATSLAGDAQLLSSHFAMDPRDAFVVSLQCTERVEAYIRLVFRTSLLN